jgi:hypothetical protein
MQYLLEQCPAMIRMIDGNGHNPLHIACKNSSTASSPVIMLLNADPTLARDKCTDIRTVRPDSQQLPLHLLIKSKCYQFHLNSSSIFNNDNGDCSRLLLNLYPASAGIKDEILKSPYDLAVIEKIGVHFIRLLLNADRTIDPIKRGNLNYAARKEGMFLALRALSTNLEPIIWSKIRYEDKDLLARVMSYL